VRGFWNYLALGDRFPLAAVEERFYVRRMKRFFVWFIALTMLTPTVLRAQTPEAAAAIAEKQAEDERYKRLSSQLEDLQALVTQQAKKIAELTSQLVSLREDHAQREGRAAPMESLKQLAEDIQEVDKKRLADNKLIREELAKILKAVSETAPLPSASRTRPPVELKPAPPAEAEPKGEVKAGKVYEYTVQKDDTLSAIAAAYRAQGVKVSVDDILKANPGLKPEQMRIGQKLTIPAPGN
jgi:LysM repeat protein